MLDRRIWEWDLSFRWEWKWDGNGNEVIEMGGIGTKNLFPHTSSGVAIRFAKSGARNYQVRPPKKGVAPGHGGPGALGPKVKRYAMK